MIITECCWPYLDNLGDLSCHNLCFQKFGFTWFHCRNTYRTPCRYRLSYRPIPISISHIDHTKNRLLYRLLPAWNLCNNICLIAWCLHFSTINLIHSKESGEFTFLDINCHCPRVKCFFEILPHSVIRLVDVFLFPSFQHSFWKGKQWLSESLMKSGLVWKRFFISY